MNFKKLEKLKWNIEHYDGCPAFTEMTAHGFTSFLYESKIPVYRINLSYYSHGEGDWMSLFSDHNRIGSAIVSEFISNQKTIMNLHSRWLKNFKTMMDNFYSLFNVDLSGFADNKLICWAENIYKFYKKISMPGFIDGYMFYADKRLDGLLKDFCAKKGIKNYQRIYSILSAPAEPSFINKEEDDLRAIVKLLQTAGYGSRSDLRKYLRKTAKQGILKMFENHLHKYSWIKSSYAGYSEYSWDQMENEAKKIISEENSFFNNIYHKNKKLKEEIIKKHKFTKEIRAIAKLTEIFVEWQDQRKIYTLTFVSLQNKLLREIAKRTKIDLELLKYCRTEEIAGILHCNFNIEELKRRKKACLFFYAKGRITGIITGPGAKKFLNAVSRIDINKINEIKGLSASMGKCIGKVKIVISAKNISKVNSGEILVAPMTRPEHLMGMKKAGAIITDDGGITCHAAIIARELGIPCIIGTKIATKVLKDGDFVEVDAERGIVKILKKNKT
ncbi:hypothetical protein KKC83_03405 [Patescibacteria group bacterium]|nr:hypothetical protein [Patescibacteria group bacterium]MBU4015235.1 hypothetical protein [Patescibacteria group bacterium]MBU4026560.1 hypothetical protein [Patescibacteria group bacterium]MBU4073459.1 hypothetical protein [Patescibacteria group bacterium]MBU4103336.1 hypothetical protein [Patescibacteria group bacterium]